MQLKTKLDKEFLKESACEPRTGREGLENTLNRKLLQICSLNLSNVRTREVGELYKAYFFLFVSTLTNI